VLPNVDRWTRFAAGQVVSVDTTRSGVQELTCLVEGRPVAALAYTGLLPQFVPGAEVVLNLAAIDAGLGTGGWAFVVAPMTVDQPADAAGGLLVKARYTPLQAATRGVDEQTSPYHRLLADASDLGGMPVVTADLHSALPAIVAGIRAEDPGLRIAYVMTDGGALPAAFSCTVDQLQAAGHVAATITAGQAYGGTFEAVTVHSALLAARLVVAADVAIVTQGPGNLGTGTKWGFSGVAVGEAVNAAALLLGRPVGALRVSAADPRPRHRGLSHHSVTAYGQVALRPAELVVPALPPDGDGDAGSRSLAPLHSAIVQGIESLVAPAGIHAAVHVSVDGLFEALAANPVKLSSMGRGLEQDPAAFLASAAAGRHAARIATGA
jgi:hypothetical protein